MRVLIIDDERLARDELRRLLLDHPWITVVGEAANVENGLRQVAALAPELIFLDVQMPDGSGFDLLAALDNPPAVIFTTAWDRYAIRAFDVSALDYLLKPIDPPRLAAGKFMRISRSRIVNLAKVSGIEAAPAGGMTLILRDGLRVGMSRRRAILFRQLNRL